MVESNVTGGKVSNQIIQYQTAMLQGQECSNWFLLFFFYNKKKKNPEEKGIKQ